MPTAFYRRNLPHLQHDMKPHFLTFCTRRRWVLPEPARSLVLQSCLHDHETKLFVYCVAVMPDHAHMIFVPLVDEQKREIVSLATITQAIKSASAHNINRLLGRKGTVWQEESFDHVLRCSEALNHKIEYVLNNPVRAGLVTDSKKYQWLWQAPDRDPFAPPNRPASATFI
jgi:REP element-mobilizing transposase RayT